jgi:hypothetical protein
MTAASPTSVQDEVLARVLQGESMQPTTQDDWYQFMGQIYYLVKDDETFQELRDDSDLKVLMPTLSHLLRTSNLDKKTIKEMKLRWRRAVRLQLLCKKNPTLVSQAKFDAWVNFGYAAIEDAKEGWRGRLVTERIKTYKIEMGSKRRGKFLGLF